MKTSKSFRKLSICAIALFGTVALFAEQTATFHYDMTFKGRGESTTVQTVTVENLTQGTSLQLDGTDVLRLSDVPEDVGIDNIESSNRFHPTIHPNPAPGAATLTFWLEQSGAVDISIANIGGWIIARRQFTLEAGEHRATLPALPGGMYIANIRPQGSKMQAVKWLSTGNGSASVDITLVSNANADLPAEAPMVLRSSSQPASTTNSVMRLLPLDQQTLVTGESTNKTILPLRYAASENENIVGMLYTPGDLLRFTGESGNMTTIVMNIPTCSHDITFDFYNCTDAGGYHYTIVNVGGMLWMTEDLRNVPATLVPVRANQSQWSGYPADQPKQAYPEFSESNAAQGGYYNYAGAQAALPEGWSLPTAGEIDYMYNKLGGYDVAANKLKARGNAWAQQQNTIDSLSFGAVAMGELTPEGTFAGEDFRVKYWTRSTKNGAVTAWGIENATVLLTADQPDARGNGFRVRGCRPAPSAYADVIELFNAQQRSAELRATTLFADGPLGGIYNLTVDKKNLWIDLQADNAATPAMKYLDYNRGTNGTLTNVPGTRTGHINKLQKMAAIDNANGTQNMAKAMWSRSTNPFTSPTIDGDGYISIIIYGDSTQNYAKLDSIQLPTQYLMPFQSIDYSAITAKDFAWNLVNPILSQYISSAQSFITPSHVYDEIKRVTTNLYSDVARQHILNPYKYYASRMQFASADFNADGTGDFVVMVGSRVDVYSGVAPYPILFTKTFTKNNLRMAVGDVDGNKNPDIAVVYPIDGDNAQVEVYADGNLGNTPSYFITVPAGNNNDIKIGNIKNGGQNSIVVLTRQDAGASNIRVIDYNAQSTGSLAIHSALSKSIAADARTNNDNITLCRFRGSTYPADLVVQNKVYRHNNSNQNFDEFAINVITTDYAQHILSDNITAGNFNKDEQGKETLEFICTALEAGTNTATTTPIIQQLITGTPYYDVVGNIAFSEKQSAVRLAPSNAGATTFSATNRVGATNTTTFTLNYSGRSCVQPMVNNIALLYLSASFDGITKSNSGYNFSAIGGARSTEPGKSLKYVSHKTAMSEPRIYALLAAPPFYKYKADGTKYEYPASAGMGTSWGKTEVTGTGKANESSHSMDVIFGFEQDITFPITGTKLGGIDFTTKLTSEWTSGTETNTITTQSIEFTAPQSDAVILSASFYDTYTYEIVSSSNEDEIGSLLNISFPSQARTLGLNLEDYNRLAADNPECPNLKQLFTHRVGFPFTYPSEKSKIMSNVAPFTVLWAAPFGGQEFISIGSGNDVNRSISLDSQTTQTAGFTFGMDMELVVNVLGVKGGVGYGYNNTNTSSHTEGEGHSIAGHVAGLKNIGEHGLSDFSWTVAWYKYRIGGQEFPVVYYVVQ